MFSWGVKNLPSVIEWNWINFFLLLVLHHLSHQITVCSVICSSTAAMIESWKLITLWCGVRWQRENIFTNKRKYLFPRLSTWQFPDLGPVSGAVTHQLSSHLHRSPETWLFWSWLVDCLARNQTSWIFSFLNVSSFFRSASKSLGTSICVFLFLNPEEFSEFNEGMRSGVKHTGNSMNAGMGLKVNQHLSSSLVDPS